MIGRKTKRKLTLQVRIVAALGGLLVALLVAPGLPCSRLARSTESIDITSGRYRRESYLFSVRWTDRTEETALSRLFRDLIGEPPEAVWRRVNTFSLGSESSPHYRHHGALYAARTLTNAFDRAMFRGDAQKEAIEMFLWFLQEDDSYFRAKVYAMRVGEISWDTESGIEICPDDLPNHFPGAESVYG